MSKSKKLYANNKNGILKKNPRNSYTFSNPRNSDSNYTFGSIKGPDFHKHDNLFRNSIQSPLVHELPKPNKVNISVNRQEVVLDKMVSNPKICHKFDLNLSCFVLCVRFINDNYFAIACDDNMIRIFSYYETTGHKLIKEFSIGFSVFSMISIKQKTGVSQMLPYALVCGGVFPRNIVSIYS